MAEFAKYRDMHDIEHLLKHYGRQNFSGRYRNPDIDTSKTGADYNLAPDRGNYRKTLKYLREKLQEISPKQRRDGVKMCDWVVTLPKPSGGRRIDEKQFFRESYQFLKDRYGSKSGLGEDVVLSAYVHKDEGGQPHMHFAFLPVLERDGKKAFCARDLIDKAELKSIHTELEAHLVSHGICHPGDIVSGVTKAQGGNRTVAQLKADRDRTREESRWDADRDDRDRGGSRWGD